MLGKEESSCQERAAAVCALLLRPTCLGSRGSQLLTASLLCLPAAFGKAAVPRVQPLQGLLVGSLASSWVFFFSFLLLK